MREPQSPTGIMPACSQTLRRRGRRPRIPSLSTISNSTGSKHQPPGQTPPGQNPPAASQAQFSRVPPPASRNPSQTAATRPAPKRGRAYNPHPNPKSTRSIQPALRIVQIAVNLRAGDRASADGQDRCIKRPCPDWPQQFFHLYAQSKPNPRSSANMRPGASAAPIRAWSGGATSAGRYRQP
jgi:hypothetical protein